jgi:hypothetical protein
MDSFKQFLKSDAFKKRLKSFFWRMGGMMASSSMAFTIAELTAWNPNSVATIFVGLVFGEVTKYLNSKN